MKLELPASTKEITIRQAQKQGERDLDLYELVSIYADISYKDIRKLPKALVEEGAAYINRLIATLDNKLRRVITIDGKEYGLIPDWAEFTTGEYIDSEEYLKNPIQNAHKIMAIMYRPITRRVGKAYEIEEYQGTKKADIFKPCPLEYYNGLLAFFLTTKQTYLTSLAQSLSEAGKSLTRTQSAGAGGGIIPLALWPRVMYSKLKSLLKLT
jgi:hypothetical protein